MRLKKNYRKHDEYITTQDCNKLMSESFETRLKQVNLATKAEIVNFVKKTIT